MYYTGNVLRRSTYMTCKDIWRKRCDYFCITVLASVYVEAGNRTRPRNTQNYSSSIKSFIDVATNLFQIIVCLESRKKMSVDHILNKTYSFRFCIINDKTLSSLVPILGQ